MPVGSDISKSNVKYSSTYNVVRVACFVGVGVGVGAIRQVKSKRSANTLVYKMYSFHL